MFVLLILGTYVALNGVFVSGMEEEIAFLQRSRQTVCNIGYKSYILLFTSGKCSLENIL